MKCYFKNNKKYFYFLGALIQRLLHFSTQNTAFFAVFQRRCEYEIVAAFGYFQ